MHLYRAVLAGQYREHGGDDGTAHGEVDKAADGSSHQQVVLADQPEEHSVRAADETGERGMAEVADDPAPTAWAGEKDRAVGEHILPQGQSQGPLRIRGRLHHLGDSDACDHSAAEVTAAPKGVPVKHVQHSEVRAAGG
jgi:hypothetical protein